MYKLGERNIQTNISSKSGWNKTTTKTTNQRQQTKTTKKKQKCKNAQTPGDSDRLSHPGFWLPNRLLAPYKAPDPVNWAILLVQHSAVQSAVLKIRTGPGSPCLPSASNTHYYNRWSWRQQGAGQTVEVQRRQGQCSCSRVNRRCRVPAATSLLPFSLLFKWPSHSFHALLLPVLAGSHTSLTALAANYVAAVQGRLWQCGEK